MLKVTDTHGNDAIINVNNVTFIRQRKSTVSPDMATEIYFMGQKNHPITVTENMDTLMDALKVKQVI